MELICPSCQSLLALPDSAAGKRGKCPSCDTEFTVPPNAAPDDEPAIERQRGRETPLSESLVRCPACERTLAHDPALAGQTIICPTCQRRLRMPDSGGQVADLGHAPTLERHRSWQGWERPQPRRSAPATVEDDPASVTGNPYSPVDNAAPSRSSYLVPGIALVAVALPAVPIMILYLFASLMELFFGRDLGGALVGSGLAFLALASHVAAVLGGMAMIRRRNLALAKLGAVAALYPCNFCFVFQVPFAIWALVVLFQPAAPGDFATATDRWPERLP